VCIPSLILGWFWFSCATVGRRGVLRLCYAVSSRFRSEDVEVGFCSFVLIIVRGGGAGCEVADIVFGVTQRFTHDGSARAPRRQELEVR
jgi:hypothetical protein